MATTTFRNKNLVRPKKSGKAKRQRLESHKRRLAAMGMAEESIKKLNPGEIRAYLRHPVKTAAMLAAK